MLFSDHVIDLSVPCKLPFPTAERMSPKKSGLVRFEKRDGNLWLDDKEIELFLSERQMNHGGVEGFHLSIELLERGGNLPASILECMLKHPDLWPENWKKGKDGYPLFVFFWGDVFRSTLSGELLVWCAYWDDEYGIETRLRPLSDRWGSDCPAAVT